MNWTKYFKEQDSFKRYAMLEKENGLSYDHVDDWLCSLRPFLLKGTLERLTDLIGRHKQMHVEECPHSASITCSECNAFENILEEMRELRK